MPLASVRSELLGKRLRAIPLTGWPRGSTLGLQKAPSYRQLYEELSKLDTQSFE